MNAFDKFAIRLREAEKQPLVTSILKAAVGAAGSAYLIHLSPKAIAAATMTAAVSTLVNFVKNPQGGMQPVLKTVEIQPGQPAIEDKVN